MHVCAVIGSGADGVAARLTGALAERGSVAVCNAAIEPPSGGRQFRDAGAATVVASDGDRWAATGQDRPLARLLDAMAPDHDYALVVGRTVPRHPAIRVGADPDTSLEGNADHLSAVIADLESATDLDLDETVEAIEATDPYETLESLVAAVKRSADADRAGAIATFTGRVRAREGPEDAPTAALTFEKYEGVAEDRLAELADSLCEREGVLDVRLHHRTGRIEYGEDIVFVVVLAGHREEAFATCRAGIDRLKDEVPIFKREETAEETFWVHERS